MPPPLPQDEYITKFSKLLKDLITYSEVAQKRIHLEIPRVLTKSLPLQMKIKYLDAINLYSLYPMNNCCFLSLIGEVELENIRIK